MDLAFDEVETPPARRAWLWLGVACVGALLLVLFLLTPAAAAVAGLILLSAIPLAVLAGTKRTTAPLAAAGAVALVALGGSAVALAVESRGAARAPDTVTAHTGPASPPADRPAVGTRPRPHAATPPPRQARSAPRVPQHEPLVPLVPPARPAAPAAPVPAAPPPAATALAVPAPPAAPAPAPAAPATPRIVNVSVNVAWGRLSADARAQLCAAALGQGISVPLGQCR